MTLSIYALQQRIIGGNFPTNAVPISSENGEPWYSTLCPLIRNFQLVNVPGKVRKSNPTQAFVAYNGEEVTFTNYSVLVCLGI